MDIAVVTSSAFPDLFFDDHPLLAALAARGLRAQPAVWDDPSADWSAPKLAVIRSTWDYYLRLDDFLAWAAKTASVTSLWNPEPVLRWNTHKTYLRDLEQRGVPIVPTAWITAGTPVPDLAQLMAARGWQRVVIKPAVSAGAFETILVDAASVEQGQRHIERLSPGVDLMVQPFLSSVDDYGERSLLYIDGRLSHAIRRAPALGQGAGRPFDSDPAAPAPDEIDVATTVLAAAPADLLYARVDLARDDTGQPRLMELELVEPQLFLRHKPAAVDRLADAITARVRRRLTT